MQEKTLEEQKVEEFNEMYFDVGGRDKWLIKALTEAREEGKKEIGEQTVISAEETLRIANDARQEYKEELLGKLPEERKHFTTCIPQVDICHCGSLSWNDCLSEVKKLL